MILRKTVNSHRGVYRIFESGHAAFYVLDENGRTVDQFDLVPCKNPVGIATSKAFRRAPLKRGIPDFAKGFASEMNRLRRPG